MGTINARDTKDTKDAGTGETIGGERRLLYQRELLRFDEVATAYSPPIAWWKACIGARHIQPYLIPGAPGLWLRREDVEHLAQRYTKEQVEQAEE